MQWSNTVFKWIIIKYYDECQLKALEITCSELTIETLEQGVKYIQS